MGERPLDEERRPSQVGVERLGPALLGEVTERQRQRVGRAVDHDVDPSEGGDGLLDEVRDRVEIAHVGGNPDRLDAHRLEVGDHRLTGVGFAAGHGDLGAGDAEPLGDRLADAAGAAGDDGDPSGQVVESVEFLAIHGVPRARGA